MCGRFQLTKEAFEALMPLVHIPAYIQDELPLGLHVPSRPALIVRQNQEQLEGDLRDFGIMMDFKDKKKRIINARSETADSRWSFKPMLKHGRCLVPASAFYEWDSDKECYEFYEKDWPVMFLAALYDEAGFVILTTAANESMIDYHHRMPLILQPDEICPWIFDDKAAGSILHSHCPMLEHRHIEKR